MFKRIIFIMFIIGVMCIGQAFAFNNTNQTQYDTNQTYTYYTNQTNSSSIGNQTNGTHSFPDEVTWAITEYKKPQVEFDHFTHEEYNCTVCHHTNENISCATTGCHDNVRTKTGRSSYYQAFHNRLSKKSCVGCHREMCMGPKKCNECHIK